MKYDDASWHYGGDFPEGLAVEAGATHIGMFLGWAITRGHIGEEHREDSYVQPLLEKVANREMSPRNFLIDICDEKLIDYDLSDEGNSFAEEYYESTYFEDYVTTFSEFDEVYEVTDTWENFDRIAAVIDQRFTQWQTGN